MSDEFKLTQDEKIMLIEELLQQLSENKSVLHVIQSDDALQGKPPISSNVHTYQVLGSDQPRKTQTGNLMMKVEQAHRLHQVVPQPMIDQNYEQKQGEVYRYFKNNIRCFRCKKTGHHNYSCLDVSCCSFCLSNEHYSEKCPQRTVCYNCYQWGHVLNQCPVGGGPFCQQCKRKHSRECYFLTKGIQPIKQMYNTDYLYNNQNIRCIRCFDYGHLVCSQKTDN